jgi:hypothetical protein
MVNRDVTQSAENEKMVHEIYEEYQQNNQRVHDEARASIVSEFGVSEEEAEVHPAMEDRFEQLRANANANPGITSIDPTTGVPGASVAPPRPIAQPVPAPPQPAYHAPVQTYSNDVGTLENIIRANGFNVLQSASDYSQGIITLVISR